MQIKYHHRFLKQLDKLQKHQKVAVKDAIDTFRKDPFDHSLKNHSLKGSMKGIRALSAGFDLRIIFQETQGYTFILFLAVGTHDDVYK